MAQTVVVPPNFSSTKPGPGSSPNGHQNSTTTVTMGDWVRRDQENKESQPQVKYS